MKPFLPLSHRDSLRFVFYFLFPALCLSCGAPSPSRALKSDAPQGIAWRRDTTFFQLLQEAKETKRPLLLDFYADWCTPCKEMEEKVYRLPEVGEAAKGFLAIQLDGERGEGAALYAKYRVSGYPAVIFFDPEGNEIRRITGSVDAQTFLQILKEVERGR